jgi:hypothetical protein
MPQPTGRDLHVDRLLSNLSVGYLNEPSSYIADLVFPVVRVNKQTDKYAIYRKGDWFRDEAAMRAPLTESAGGGYSMSEPGTFICDEWSFHKDIADEDMGNQDEVFDNEDDATQFVTEKLRLRRERIWATNFFGTDIWDNDLEGQTDTPGENEFKCWDESGSTPIDDIEGAKALIQGSIGMMPNTLVVASRVHQALKNHSDIVDRFKYTQSGVITAELLAKVFEVDRYLVGSALYATNQENETDSTNDDLSFILNQYGALLVYSAPKPSKRRPSGGYTFRWRRPYMNGVSGEVLESTIRKFRLEKVGGTRIEGSIYEDLKLVGTACGCFFNNAISAGRTIES